MKGIRREAIWHERGYAAGVAFACATIVDIWGDEVQAQEILLATGLTRGAQLKRLGVDEYDLERLAPVFKTLSARAKRRRRAARTAS